MSPRLGYAIGFVVCAGLLGFALYLQYFEGQEPCPLCALQRVAFMALAVAFLAGALHGPARAGAMLYGGLQFIIAAVGAAIAARHVWLQHLPKDLVPECGPGLEYILRKYSALRALEKVLAGSGECAEVSWRLLGLSIAEWSLFWLLVLAIYALYLTLAARRRYRSR